MKQLRPTIAGGNKVLWGSSSFAGVAPERLEAHLARRQYGEFRLTDAIRPSFDLQVVPKAGYRQGTYHDELLRRDLPTLSVCASAEYLFDLFLDLVALLGNEVAVVLESSHEQSGPGHVDLVRDAMDNVVLRSILCDFERLLLDDGYTGIAVLNAEEPAEVQLDDHKLIFVYAPEIQPYREVLERYGLQEDERLRLLTDAEHLHLSDPEFVDLFRQLQIRLGIE
jgi:hypothetical protein